MAGLVEKFGRYMDKLTASRPDSAAKILRTAYKAFGWKQKHFPNKLLPPSRQFLATVCMDCMVKPLSSPGAYVLTSLFTPCELFYAMDLPPMCAEQYSTYANGAGAEHGFIEAAENAGIAETYCSYHKVVIGAVLSGVMPRPAAIVNTSLACDANNLTFRKAAEIFDVPQFYIDIPYRPSEEAVDYVADQLKEAAAWLEQVTGRKLSEEKLKNAVDNSRKTLKILEGLIPLRKERFVPSELTAELYEALLTHNALGLTETLKYAKLLEADYKNAAPAGGRKILWLHTNPFYQKSVKDIFNYVKDPRIILTEMSYDALNGFEEEDPYRFMAARVVYDSYNGPVKRRTEKAVEMAKASGADGAVLFCHWGCKETCGAAVLMQEAFDRADIPLLVINGDGVDRRNSPDGQIITRMKAFLEMLEMRKE